MKADDGSEDGVESAEWSAGRKKRLALARAPAGRGLR